ncbi:MAG: PilZ domain-containing protein [Candidatus Ratteibacteria bacterium]|nr:PilZ domain-containing protein [Candidatus Ratteibacteria bacterium]
MENKFSKKPDSAEKPKEESSIFINQTKEGSSEVYRLTVGNIPHGQVEEVFTTPAILVHAKTCEKSPVYNLFTDKEFFIGRNSKNHLCLQGKDIADVHAKIRPEKEGYVLYDLTSKSGVKVNWEKVIKRKLEHRDRIKIGEHILIFQLLQETKGEPFTGIERRKSVRVFPEMDVKLLVCSLSKLEELSGTVIDISLDGMRIETEKELSKSTVINAGLSCKTMPILEVMAQVIWTKSKQKESKMFYQTGLQFIEMDDVTRAALQEYLIKCVV